MDTFSIADSAERLSLFSDDGDLLPDDALLSPLPSSSSLASPRDLRPSFPNGGGQSAGERGAGRETGGGGGIEADDAMVQGGRTAATVEASLFDRRSGASAATETEGGKTRGGAMAARLPAQRSNVAPSRSSSHASAAQTAGKVRVSSSPSTGARSVPDRAPTAIASNHLKDQRTQQKASPSVRRFSSPSTTARSDLRTSGENVARSKSTSRNSETSVAGGSNGTSRSSGKPSETNVSRSNSTSRSSKLPAVLRSASPVISSSRKPSEEALRRTTSSCTVRNSDPNSKANPNSITSNSSSNPNSHPFPKSYNPKSKLAAYNMPDSPSRKGSGNHVGFGSPTGAGRLSDQSLRGSVQQFNSSDRFLLNQSTKEKLQKHDALKINDPSIESILAANPRRHSIATSAIQRVPSTPHRRKSDPRSLQQTDLKSEDVRLDLRGQNIRRLDSPHINLTPKLEFVYLRGNQLSSMAGLEILKRVKVLDLSFNEFNGDGFEPLSNLKALQQLYLAGNQIKSLAALPQLPNLEFLSVAQNSLKNLAMPSQPKLQVLAASDNNISTFKGFPYLPVLEHLRLENNPILDMPHAEAASILISGMTLKRFNNRDLSLEEQKLAMAYPAHTALCLREGWEFSVIEEAPESTLKFLVEKWREILPPGYTVKKASVDPPYVGDCCTCYFILETENGEEEKLELRLTYQWYIGDKTESNFVPIEGANCKAYWPKLQDVGCCLKVECTPVINDVTFPSIFAISSPVAAGTGFPKVLSLSVDGELIEGKTIRPQAEVAWCGGTPAKAIVSWLRRHGGRSPVAIMGAEEHEYQLSLEDVGANLLLMYTPVTEEGIKGESQFATTGIIEAASPSVKNVRITGPAVEGMTITGTGEYFGGNEGPSKLDWLREDPQSGEFKLISRGTSEYMVSSGDVGLQLMFIYTPINAEGLEGYPVSATTANVLVAPPKVMQLKIIGDLVEGNVVSISANIVGGTEDVSRVQWFKTDDPAVESNLEAISSSKVAKDFRIPVGAVSYYLAAKYTPCRSDGDCGEPMVVISDQKVEMLPPSLTFLSINGEAVEGEILVASYGYVGGHEGKSEYSWFVHKDENDIGVPIPTVNGLLKYKITAEAIDKLVSFKCTPVREDGVFGESRSTLLQEYVQPGPPMLSSLQVLGDPIEGAVLTIEKEYCGGVEGPSKVQWFLKKPSGVSHAIRGATTSSYKVLNTDIGCLIYVSCEPVRVDGMKGSSMVSPHVGPVLPGPPTCEFLKICGHPIEGGSLTFEANYSGGEKGPCISEWYRQNTNGKEDWLSNNERLDLTSKDVGSRILLVFTPVRKDKVIGSVCRSLSEVVANADPIGVKLSIPHCQEGREVIPEKLYYGGTEGSSDYKWYRLKSGTDRGVLPDEAIHVANTMEYVPTSDDVGMYLALSWTPIRIDGKMGKVLVASSSGPVMPAMPTVSNVRIQQLGSRMLLGLGDYHGGSEGNSSVRWYRETNDKKLSLIEGATSKTYLTVEEDYTCCLVFSYTPVREDGMVGKEVLSEKSDPILPDIPRPQKLSLSGKAAEGEVLTVTGVIFDSDDELAVWQKYKKEARYQWFRSTAPENPVSFDLLPLQRMSSYKIRSEDVGLLLRCECTMIDIFGRNMEPVPVITDQVLPGTPKIDKLEIEGRGFHTNLYAVRGIYSGGKEGKSTIQWFRAMSGTTDLLSITGEVGRMYEANVDDIGCRLVAVYTPVRDDGVSGAPVSASTDMIAVEPEVAREVKQKLELGAIKFEALRDRDQSSSKGQSQQGLGSLERRVLDVNKKRFKVVKPGSKTSFPNTEIRGTYSPPFRVEIVQNDQHRLKIIVDNENEIDLMVQTRGLRDVIVLVLRGFAQRFNGTTYAVLK